MDRSPLSGQQSAVGARQGTGTSGQRRLIPALALWALSLTSSSASRKTKPSLCEFSRSKASHHFLALPVVLPQSRIALTASSFSRTRSSDQPLILLMLGLAAAGGGLASCCSFSRSTR